MGKKKNKKKIEVIIHGNGPKLSKEEAKEKLSSVFDDPDIHVAFDDRVLSGDTIVLSRKTTGTYPIIVFSSQVEAFWRADKEHRIKATGKDLPEHEGEVPNLSKALSLVGLP